MQFETFLVLLPSGAGGHQPDADRAQAIAVDLKLTGWIFGCRFAGYCRGRRKTRPRGRRILAVSLLWTLGQPDPQAMASALVVAGQRHCVEYVLVA